MKTLLLSFTAILTFNFQLLTFNSFGQYTTIHNFDSINGSFPQGSLISVGNFLYGTASSGGINNLGVIFKIMPDGSEYSKVLDFAGATNGSNPNSSLISLGTFLYGTTFKGGKTDDGTIFKIKPDGTGYSKLLDFGPKSGSNANGPVGSLISDGTFLYGMTRYGGASFYYGALFKIKPEGTEYSVLHDFTAENGSYPNGSLFSDGTFLYGVTERGGKSNYHRGCGTIFKIKFDGTEYSILLDFADHPKDGTNPVGSLISDGIFLYGMTRIFERNEDGDITNTGTIFKIKPDGTSYSKLIDLDCKNRSYPNGSLISVGNFLYGTTLQGGKNNNGTVFKISAEEASYSKLYDFNQQSFSNGSNLIGSPISDGNFSVYNNGAMYYYNTKQITEKSIQPPAQKKNGIYFQNDSLIKILAKIKSEGKDNFIAGKAIHGKIIQYLKKVANMSFGQLAEEYFSANPKVNSNLINWSVIFDFSDSVSVKSPVFKYLISNRENFNNLYTNDSIDLLIRDVYCSAMNRCLVLLPNTEPDTTRYKILRTELMALKLPSGNRFISGMDLFLYENTQNWQQYAKTAVLDIENYRYDDYEALNEYAFAFYEHINDSLFLNKALGWAKKANDLKVDDPAILDTYACLLFKTGQKLKAIKTEEKALESINKNSNFLGDKSPYVDKLAEFKK